MLENAEWYVYRENVNSKTIEPYNIFKNNSFYRDCENCIKTCDDIDSFFKRLDKLLMYYFWARCEYEIVLTGWPSPEYTKDKKIDIYDQVTLNYQAFVDYIWNNFKTKKENN